MDRLVMFTALIAMTLSPANGSILLEQSDADTGPNGMRPMVVNTWNFTTAAAKAFSVLQGGGSAIDAVVAGCGQCQVEQCAHTVGYGGSPAENGETTLDAMVMDGCTHNVGAVGALKRIKSAVEVARHVLHYTKHSMLVGDDATRFAVKMGFKEEDLTTEYSRNMTKAWQENSCQPNFWLNVVPDPSTSCGPYDPDAGTRGDCMEAYAVAENNHDTIGMVALDAAGRVACATTTNGLSYKIRGRVGDSPLPGSGCFADTTVGGATATGDGDIIMRFVPSYQAVESMRNGMTPQEAVDDAIRRIIKLYPKFRGAVVAMDRNGNIGARGNCLTFDYSYSNQAGGVTVAHIPPLQPC